MGDSTSRAKYVLVLKDDASNYDWLLRLRLLMNHCFTVRFRIKAPILKRSFSSSTTSHGRAPSFYHCEMPQGKWYRGGSRARGVAMLPSSTFGVATSGSEMATSDYYRATAYISIFETGGACHGKIGIAAINPVGPIITPSGVEPPTLAEISLIRGANFEKVKKLLVILHKRLASTKQTARNKGRVKSSKLGAKMAQFAIGGYVRYADVLSYRRSKLRIK
ncbi:hypothetical protein PHPALM_30836 [Phytophthora palmivora]|uniref:Uncharacterized protein n=1 Tax=Phytophthora palmivora TaxID=4796 RepID=A0A2P4X446_9STRA|nr:hypothetical protein PHPALM_30836 [Phytophthora palmivora]